MSIAPRILLCSYAISRYSGYLSTLSPLNKFRYISHRIMQSVKVHKKVLDLYLHHPNLIAVSRERAENLQNLLIYITDRYELRSIELFHSLVLNKIRLVAQCNLIEDKTKIEDARRRIGDSCIIWLPEKNRYCCNKMHPNGLYLCTKHYNRQESTITRVHKFCPLGRDLNNIVANYFDYSAFSIGIGM
jgi:hypothetical protein